MYARIITPLRPIKNAKGLDPTIHFSDDIYAYIDEAYKMMGE